MPFPKLPGPLGAASLGLGAIKTVAKDGSHLFSGHLASAGGKIAESRLGAAAVSRLPRMQAAGKTMGKDFLKQAPGTVALAGLGAAAGAMVTNAMSKPDSSSGDPSQPNGTA